MRLEFKIWKKEIFSFEVMSYHKDPEEWICYFGICAILFGFWIWNFENGITISFSLFPIFKKGIPFEKIIK